MTTSDVPTAVCGVTADSQPSAPKNRSDGTMITPPPKAGQAADRPRDKADQKKQHIRHFVSPPASKQTKLPRRKARVLNAKQIDQLFGVVGGIAAGVVVKQHVNLFRFFL